MSCTQASVRVQGCELPHGFNAQFYCVRLLCPQRHDFAQTVILANAPFFSSTGLSTLSLKHEGWRSAGIKGDRGRRLTAEVLTIQTGGFGGSV